MSTSARLANELATTYADFGKTLAWLDASELEAARLPSGWTPKMVLAHVGFWDDVQTRRMEAAVQAGSSSSSWRPADSNDERAALDAARSWAEVNAAADAARQRMVEFAASLSEEALAREYPEGEIRLSLEKLLHHMVKHARQHTADIEAYCGSMQRWSRPELRRFLVQQMENLMDSVGGLSEQTILTATVDGQWTIRDTLVHVLAWQEVCVSLLRHWPTTPPEAITEWQFREGELIDDLNARLREARAGLHMIDVMDGLMTCYRRILTRFDQFGDAELREAGQTWNGTGVLSCFFYDIACHSAEHAEEIWVYRASVADPTS